jgi:phenylacetate-CoA ligase
MIEKIKHIPFLVKDYWTIRHFENWPQEKIKRYQARAFQKIFESAKKIPFYQELYKEAGVFDMAIKSIDDIKRLPVIDKALCRERGYEDYFLKKKIPGSIVTPTSGSTGNPFQIRIPERMELSSPLRVIHAMRQFGWKPLDKGLEIWVGETKPHKSLMRKFGLLISVSIFETPEIIKEIIVKEKPDYIFSNRTSLEALMEYLQKVNLYYRPKFLLSSAAEVFPQHRQKLENHFQAKLINIYGCLEAPTMAYSCPECDQFHVFQTTAIAEVMEPRIIDGVECGDLVITNLSNDVMPFIRYRTGDVVSVTDEKCKCRRNSQIIGEIMGRSDDIIKLRNGRVFNYLHFWLRFKKPLLIDYIDKIEQYKIWYRKGTDEIFFQFRLNDKISRQEGTVIIDKILKEHFSDIECKYEIVDNIPLSSSGKFKIIEVVED